MWKPGRGSSLLFQDIEVVLINLVARDDHHRLLLDLLRLFDIIWLSSLATTFVACFVSGVS
jgi:hypothetical protein